MSKLTFIAQLSLDYIFGDIKKLPESGEEVIASTSDIQLGGGTLVYPIVLTKMGIDCKVIIKKSDSIQADIAYKLLKTYAVKEIEIVEAIDFNPVMSTAVLSLESDRSFVSYNNEKALLFDDAFLVDRLKNSKVVFALERNIDIMPKFKENGSTIVFDIGWSDDLNIDRYKGILNYVDYFTPNDKEAMKMTKTESVEDSLLVLQKYVKHPIVSCGAQGCKTIVDGDIIHVKAPKNIKTVDTTGAGDHFMAGLIYGIYQDMSIESCMKMANCTGALSTTAYGCYGAEYVLEDVLKLYNEMC